VNTISTVGQASGVVSLDWQPGSQSDLLAVADSEGYLRCYSISKQGGDEKMNLKVSGSYSNCLLFFFVFFLGPSRC
jgi:hypothetical protein